MYSYTYEKLIIRSQSRKTTLVIASHEFSMLLAES